MKTIHLVCAARPNFMKIAPLYHALRKEAWANPVIVHTGQHYDLNMSDTFFTDLRLPEPHIHLGVGSGSHAEQTGHVMINYEKILMQDNPDLVVVVGDVNSTMAATIAAVKLGIKVAHLEAGLRSFDRTMPEEINRLVTDSLCDLLWTPSEDADNNLISEGIPYEKIQCVGNIMIDSLEMIRDTIENEEAYKAFDQSPNSYGVVTLHRPSNVDSPDNLRSICNMLNDIAEKTPLLFPVHPRTRKNLDELGMLGILEKTKNLYTPEPLSYIPFLNLIFNCKFVITDSGGIQEETAYLNIPCFTLRANTERPITITQGTNHLCDLKNIRQILKDVLASQPLKRESIKLWDGKTAARVINSIKSFLNV